MKIQGLEENPGSAGKKRFKKIICFVAIYDYFETFRFIYIKSVSQKFKLLFKLKHFNLDKFAFITLCNFFFSNQKFRSKRFFQTKTKNNFLIVSKNCFC